MDEETNIGVVILGGCGVDPANIDHLRRLARRRHMWACAHAMAVTCLAIFFGFALEGLLRELRVFTQSEGVLLVVALVAVVVTALPGVPFGSPRAVVLFR
ncbi:uncharacterized protein K452DRAFT_282992 [Aplosporella prunicola CBS 121167]|uniref:Uncharacterized protein n=1 Tax=Aplosporella prunicola CBS 121167 TaxID=1176127 RepID=A0A6A6BTU3_9PEZI|nr:uncharacterized protein K452DRAFT_282992 [Aplosporella prunicola CBS 121167]KAF2146793.1 hypothetical protein K452DRAFT_282992 [Aplosporella prunicola CBS 121167]